MKRNLMIPLAVGVISWCTEANSAPLSYSFGDLFLCFRQDGNAENYLVKIGKSSDFANVSGSITVSGLGNIKADLDAVFGPTWSSDGAVSWGVCGTSGNTSGANGEPVRTLFASKARLDVSTQSSPWDRGSFFAQGPTDSKMRSLGDAYQSVAGVTNQSTANSTVAFRQSTGAANSYASFQAAGSSFSYFSPSIEGNFGAGASGTALDLFRLKTGTGPGDYLGTFTLSAAGVLTFSNQTVVPFNAVVTGFSRTGNAATITGLGTPNAAYRIQRSVDLASWTTLTSPTINANGSGTIQFVDGTSPNGKAFYRIAAP